MSDLRLPDFIIGGSPRCGTTWMYQVLDRHPDIRMARPMAPEPKFFLVDDLFDKGLAYYSRTWFKEIPEGVLAGEKSANYLEQPRVADRIGRCLPHVKLIFLLRNPVHRAYSNWLWSRKNGLESEDFETAIALEKERDNAVPEHLKFARPHAYASRGLYADQLAPFMAAFPREQILCLFYEKIATSPANLAGEVHRFLGIAARPQDAAGLNAVNAAPIEGRGPPTACFEMLREQFAEPNRRLVSLLGLESDPWPNS